MEAHVLSEFLPAMADAEFEAFRQDIKANGLRVPITLFEGKVLDGRHRLRACEESGVNPRFVEFSGTEEEAARLVGSLNMQRRNLTKGQLGFAAGKLKEWFAVRAKERALQNLKRGRSSEWANLPTREDEGRARDQAAAAFGVSGRTVDDAVAVAKSAAPEVVAMVERGNMAIHEALVLSKLPEKRQRELASIDDKKKRRAATRKSVNTSRGRARSESNKEHVRQAADAPGTQHVRFVLSRLEAVVNEMARADLEATAFARKFIDEFDWSDKSLSARLAYVSPAIEAFASLSIMGRRAQKEAA